MKRVSYSLSLSLSLNLMFIRHKVVIEFHGVHCVCVAVAVRALEHYGFPCAIATARTLDHDGIVNVSVTSEMSFTFF